MFYTIYKITNLIDSKIYIGAHSTQDLNDGYMGSGKYLRNAIKKYGIENFKKDILFIFDNKQEMFSKEAELVTEDFIATSNTYNIKPGGSGGNPGIVGAFKGMKHSESSKEKIRKSALSQVSTVEKRKKLSDNNWAKRDPEAHRSHMRKIANRPRTTEHNRKVAEANLGKILVNDGMIAKRINKDQLSYYESLGWNKGGMPRKK